MSSKHLSVGSEEPPRVKGLLRLYSMQYCPFAQRARLVLGAKNIQHDIVNINLSIKPEWYFKIHPEGKVPTLLDGEKFIFESLDVADYLDEKYPPRNSLYPSDPEAKEKEKNIIRTLLDPQIANFYKCLRGQEERSLEQWIELFLGSLEPLEQELSSRGTTFFGGEKPGMLDYMLWPWAERAGCISIKFGQKLPLKNEDIPSLRKWAKALRQDPVVSSTYEGPEKYYKISKGIRTKDPELDYDNL
jgi:glutathione S-transferase